MKTRLERRLQKAKHKLAKARIEALRARLYLNKVERKQAKLANRYCVLYASSHVHVDA